MIGRSWAVAHYVGGAGYVRESLAEILRDDECVGELVESGLGLGLARWRILGNTELRCRV